MAEEMRNKFVSWTLNVVKEIKEIPAKNGNAGDPHGRGVVCGVGIGLAVVQAPSPSPPPSRVGVDSVHPSGPASAAGILPGDVIVEVDDRRFDDGGAYLPDDVAGAIRGPEGTRVGVIVERGGEEVRFELTRERIVVAGAAAGGGAARKKWRERKKRRDDRTSAIRGEGRNGEKHAKNKMSQVGKQQPEQQQLEQDQDPEPEQLQLEQQQPEQPEQQPEDYGRRIEGVRTWPEKDKGRSLASDGEEEKVAGATPPVSRADCIESLALAVEEQKESRDLSSSAEDSDQFDAEPVAEVLTPHHQNHRPLRDLAASSDEVSEAKAADRDDEISSIVAGSVGSDSQWEMISERSGSAIVISFNGSMYSGSTSFRSASPSMLKNKFVLTESTGEPYIEHVVLPTDTLQGLCLAYKISATRLRMENGFSGHSLQMAPKKLRIPTDAYGKSSSSHPSEKGTMVRIQDRTSREYKLYAFVAELPSMELVEAKAYLDLSNWDLDEAIRSAREDEGWSLKEGGFDSSPGGGGADASLPLIDAVVRPKALTARDICAAPPTFEGDGFELKDIRRK